MELDVKRLPAGDPRLIDAIVNLMKSDGIFDELRRESLADIDTKPAYQNLKHRVESFVDDYLKSVQWRSNMNKNQLRDSVRRTVNNSEMLMTGVDRIVDQVIAAQIPKVFLPKVTEIVNKFLGIEEKPASQLLPPKDDLNSSTVSVYDCQPSTSGYKPVPVYDCQPSTSGYVAKKVEQNASSSVTTDDSKPTSDSKNIPAFVAGQSVSSEGAQIMNSILPKSTGVGTEKKTKDTKVDSSKTAAAIIDSETPANKSSKKLDAKSVIDNATAKVIKKTTSKTTDVKSDVKSGGGKSSTAEKTKTKAHKKDVPSVNKVSKKDESKKIITMDKAAGKLHSTSKSKDLETARISVSKTKESETRSTNSKPKESAETRPSNLKSKHSEMARLSKSKESETRPSDSKAKKSEPRPSNTKAKELEPPRPSNLKSKESEAHPSNSKESRLQNPPIANAKPANDKQGKTTTVDKMAASKSKTDLSRSSKSASSVDRKMTPTKSDGKTKFSGGSRFRSLGSKGSSQSSEKKGDVSAKVKNVAVEPSVKPKTVETTASKEKTTNKSLNKVVDKAKVEKLTAPSSKRPTESTKTGDVISSKAKQSTVKSKLESEPAKVMTPHSTLEMLLNDKCSKAVDICKDKVGLHVVKPTIEVHVSAASMIPEKLTISWPSTPDGNEQNVGERHEIRHEKIALKKANDVHVGDLSVKRTSRTPTPEGNMRDDGDRRLDSRHTKISMKKANDANVDDVEGHTKSSNVNDTNAIADLGVGKTEKSLTLVQHQSDAQQLTKVNEDNKLPEVSDEYLTDVTVSSVHTSDLSDYDDYITLSSGSDHDDASASKRTKSTAVVAVDARDVEALVEYLLKTVEEILISRDNLARVEETKVRIPSAPSMSDSKTIVEKQNVSGSTAVIVVSAAPKVLVKHESIHVQKDSNEDVEPKRTIANAVEARILKMTESANSFEPELKQTSKRKLPLIKESAPEPKKPKLDSSAFSMNQEKEEKTKKSRLSPEVPSLKPDAKSSCGSGKAQELSKRSQLDSGAGINQEKEDKDKVKKSRLSPEVSSLKRDVKSSGGSEKLAERKRPKLDSTVINQDKEDKDKSKKSRLSPEVPSVKMNAKLSGSSELKSADLKKTKLGSVSSSISHEKEEKAKKSRLSSEVSLLVLKPDMKSSSVDSEKSTKQKSSDSSRDRRISDVIDIKKAELQVNKPSLSIVKREPQDESSEKSEVESSSEQETGRRGSTRQRRLNPRYASDDFSSIFNQGKDRYSSDIFYEVPCVKSTDLPAVGTVRARGRRSTGHSNTTDETDPRGLSPISDMSDFSDIGKTAKSARKPSGKLLAPAEASGGEHNAEARTKDQTGATNSHKKATEPQASKAKTPASAGNSSTAAVALLKLPGVEIKAKSNVSQETTTKGKSEDSIGRVRRGSIASSTFKQLEVKLEPVSYVPMIKDTSGGRESVDSSTSKQLSVDVNADAVGRGRRSNAVAATTAVSASSLDSPPSTRQRALRQESQRYDSTDLYKPRLAFAGSRRSQRGRSPPPLPPPVPPQPKQVAPVDPPRRRDSNPQVPPDKPHGSGRPRGRPRRQSSEVSAEEPRGTKRPAPTPPSPSYNIKRRCRV